MRRMPLRQRDLDHITYFDGQRQIAVVARDFGFVVSNLLPAVCGYSSRLHIQFLRIGITGITTTITIVISIAGRTVELTKVS
jgi:hypothetical protein